MDKDTLIELLAMNVEHMALSYGRDWWQCKLLVDKLKSMPRWDVQWGRRVSPITHTHTHTHTHTLKGIPGWDVQWDCRVSPI
jgi:hypothetical protein